MKDAEVSRFADGITNRRLKLKDGRAIVGVLDRMDEGLYNVTPVRDAMASGGLMEMLEDIRASDIESID
jgi:hypothetical protein